MGLKAASHVQGQIQRDPVIPACQVTKCKHRMVLSIAAHPNFASGGHPGLRNFLYAHCTSLPLHVLPSTLPEGVSEPHTAKLLRSLGPHCSAASAWGDVKTSRSSKGNNRSLLERRDRQTHNSQTGTLILEIPKKLRGIN